MTGGCTFLLSPCLCANWGLTHLVWLSCHFCWDALFSNQEKILQENDPLPGSTTAQLLSTFSDLFNQSSKPILYSWIVFCSLNKYLFPAYQRSDLQKSEDKTASMTQSLFPRSLVFGGEDSQLHCSKTNYGVDITQGSGSMRRSWDEMPCDDLASLLKKIPKHKWETLARIQRVNSGVGG